jgi:hypothetical protein
MISGLNWVFSEVEQAIILEDDCLPDPSFFPFCQELLERYKDDDRIASITGSNLVGKYSNISDSYYYSQCGGIWGWATWRSKWRLYDRLLSGWPKVRDEKKLEEIFDRPKYVEYWTEIFNSMYEGTGPSAWDYQWIYTGLINGLLVVVPKVNLVANIGFGPGATHTSKADPRFACPARSIEFPLKHPSSFIPLRSLDRRWIQIFLPPSILRRIANKLYRVANRCRR